MDESRDETRREFLRGVKRWSGAVAALAVGGAFLTESSPAVAGAWANRGGSWVNHYGGGWVNGGAWANSGGSWINGGGGWVNGGGSWINGGGGGWINRYGGGGWINRR